MSIYDDGTAQTHYYHRYSTKKQVINFLATTLSLYPLLVGDILLFPVPLVDVEQRRRQKKTLEEEKMVATKRPFPLL
jgi:hypothetical protein